MTIRLRYHLAILPLFAGLGVANVLLTAGLELAEVEWGSLESARGAALGLVAFLGPEQLAGGSPAQIAARAARPVATLAGHVPGLGAAWFVRAADGAWQNVPLTAASDHAPPPPPGDDDLARLARHKTASRLVRRSGSAADETRSYAALRAPDGALLAVAGVSLHDFDLGRAWLDLSRRGVAFVAACLLAGVVVAELLTRLVRREFATLADAARSLVAGRYDAQWNDGRVRELADLGDTLRTMAGSLHDNILQTRRRLLQTDLALGEEDLFGPEPGPLDAGSVRLVPRRVGELRLDDFAGWRESSDGWRVAFGRLAHPTSDLGALPRALRAAAARDWLLGLAETGADLAPFAALHPGAAASLVFIPRDGSAPVTRSIGRGAPAVELAPGRVALGTLPADDLRFASAYLRQFPDQPLSVSADELRGILRRRISGVLLCLDHQPDGSSPSARP